MGDITFRSYERPGGASVTGTSGGRPVLTLTVTAADHDADGGGTGRAQRDVRLALHGPGDVAGLRPSAIVGTFPRPGQVDVETSFCPWVEFAAPDLAWRYSPSPPVAGDVTPWLALLVVRDDEATITGARATVDADALAAQSATSAPSLDPGAGHVHGAADDPAATCRVMCRRPLSPDTDYIALLVPAFDDAGNPRWSDGDPGSLPVYHQWRFRTGAGGDFASLATQLHAADDQDQMGRLRVELGDGVSVDVRGALTGIDLLADEPATAAQRAGLQAIVTFDPDPPGDGFDADGRRIVRPPTYGDAWTAVALGDAPDGGWFDDVNRHPVHRIVAGLGRRSAVELQEEIAAAAAERFGGTPVANERLAALSLGLAVSGRLWARVPAVRDARVALLGVSAAAILTDDGSAAGPRSLLSRVSGPDRTLPPALFSTAARRVVRSGAARFRRTPVAPERVWTAANAVPTPREDEQDEVIAAICGQLGTGEAGERVSLPPSLHVAVTEPQQRPQQRPVDLGGLDDALVAAFDPHVDPLASTRVRATIDPDEGTTAPREPEIDLDVPIWRHLRDRHREWLFPGASTLSDGEVVGLATNPQFVDALLLGVNQQAVGELRWRNMPVAARSTPLRRFWDRSPVGTSDGYDIVGIREWAEVVDASGTLDVARLGEPLGAAAHGMGDRRHLVVAFCTDLFRRYPGTMVYLAERVGGGWSDADTTGGGRTQPVFSARVTPKLVLYAFDVDPAVLRDRWVVVEQQPPGFRFRLMPGDGSTSGDVVGDAATRAAAMLERPVRVLIAGDTLTGGN